MYNFVDFTGKKIIVVGASSGIGKQTAITLSRLGAQVILLARREEKLKETLGELEGNEHCYYCIDVSETDRIEPLIKIIIEKNGKISGLVYSAGISSDTPLNLMKKEKTMRVFDTNFYGFVECVKQVCKKGRYEDNLRIVGVSSTGAIQGNRAHEAYAASKAAMDAFIRCAAIEEGKKGMCINNVAPGWTETDMVKEGRKIVGDDLDEFDRQYLGIILPEDVANLIAFLLSPAARMITGKTIMIDGGPLRI